MSLSLEDVLSVTLSTKFGHLVLRKITKIVATRCRILRLKCTKFDFGPLGELTGKELHDR